jgi:hypothetical protein
MVSPQDIWRDMVSAIDSKKPQKAATTAARAPGYQLVFHGIYSGSYRIPSKPILWQWLFARRLDDIFLAVAWYAGTTKYRS